MTRFRQIGILFLLCCIGALVTVIAVPLVGASDANRYYHTNEKPLEYRIGPKETYLDIARHFGVGYVELKAANRKVDLWALGEGDKLQLPVFHLVPWPHALDVSDDIDKRNQSIFLINLGDMRLYYLAEAPVRSWPIGIGRGGSETPTGITRITELKQNPDWTPPHSLRVQNPSIPAKVPPGPTNPLGTHFIRLGWDGYAIHGTNKPVGIGRRVSLGCIRMYPEDILEVFQLAQIGMSVYVVDIPIKLEWYNGHLYLEVHPTEQQADALENNIPFKIKDVEANEKKLRIRIAAMDANVVKGRINWRLVRWALSERTGIPQKISY